MPAGRAACRLPRSTSWARSRSESMCMSVLRVPAAATATSTPTPRPSWAAARQRRAYAGPGDRRDPAGPAGARRAARRRSARCSSAAARRPCCRPADLAAILRAIDAEFGLAAGAEVTTEANPESVDRAGAGRAAGGRVHQDLARHAERGRRTCCAVLDRAHTPGRAEQCVAWARAERVRARQPGPDLRHAGGERARTGSDRCAARSAAGPDHVSGLRADRRGGHQAGGQDQARRAARRRTTTRWPTATWPPTSCSPRAGLNWYEVSNWAAGPGSACRHNLLYWTGGNWWGIGPGAHSHVGGTRWWNVRHPAAYAGRLAGGHQPRAGQGGADRRRAADRADHADHQARVRLPGRRAEPGRAGGGRGRRWRTGWPTRARSTAGRVVLTRQGRLLADAVIRDLTD